MLVGCSCGFVFALLLHAIDDHQTCQMHNLSYLIEPEYSMALVARKVINCCKSLKFFLVFHPLSESRDKFFNEEALYADLGQRHIGQKKISSRGLDVGVNICEQLLD